MSGRAPLGECLDAAALSGHLDWRGGDARLAHLRACARCQALLASLERFEAAPGDLPAERLAEARVRLARARRDWPGLAAGQADSPARPVRATPWWEREWLGLGARAWRPALAVAVLAIVASSLYWADRDRVTVRDAGRLRAGEAPGEAGQRAALTVLPAVIGPEGPLLRWNGLPGAESYEVTLFDAAFGVLARSGAGRDTQLALAALEREAGPAARNAAYWQVAARKAGDLLAESAPQPLDPAR